VSAAAPDELDVAPVHAEPKTGAHHPIAKHAAAAPSPKPAQPSPAKPATKSGFVPPPVSDPGF
jgi:hypothetical protein